MRDAFYRARRESRPIVLCAPLGTVPVEAGSAVPPVYRWLADEPADTTVLELPADRIDDSFRYMYFSTYHWLRIVNGTSGFIP